MVLWAACEEAAAVRACASRPAPPSCSNASRVDPRRAARPKLEGQRVQAGAVRGFLRLNAGLVRVRPLKRRRCHKSGPFRHQETPLARPGSPQQPPRAAPPGAAGAERCFSAHTVGAGAAPPRRRRAAPDARAPPTRPIHRRAAQRRPRVTGHGRRRRGRRRRERPQRLAGGR